MRLLKAVFILCLLALSLCGCAEATADSHYSRLVTKAQVTWEDKSIELTEPGDIEAILSYLRLLPKMGPGLPNPSYMESPGIEILLTYEGGQHKRLLQKGVYYLSKDHLPFRPIDSKLGAQLILVLDQLS